MAGVPSTVTSIREQIREALKLSIAESCTPLDTPVSWANETDSENFPLAKAYYTEAISYTPYISKTDIVRDTLMLQIAPWCTESDYELKTSEVIESFRALFNVELVREQMYSTYQSKLCNLRVINHAMVGTSLANPYAVVEFKLEVSYYLAS